MQIHKQRKRWEELRKEMPELGYSDMARKINMEGGKFVTPQTLRLWNLKGGSYGKKIST